jgi:serine protease Do
MKTSIRMLKVASVAVLLMGIAGLLFVSAPVVRGQTVRTRPLTHEIRTSLMGGSQIGVSIRDVEESDVTREKLGAQAGAVIEDVRSDSPAAAAGMKAGDVVISFAGETVRSARQLSRLIEESPDGRAVDVVVMRNGTGAKVTLKVTPKAADTFFHGLDLGPLRERVQGFNFESFPERFRVTMPQLEHRFTGMGDSFVLFDRGRSRLGVGVQELTPQLAEFFGAKDGVLVTSVDESSAAKTAGLKAGDVITSIDGRAVVSTNDFTRRLTSTSGEVTLTIVRDKKEQTLKVRIGG